MFAQGKITTDRQTIKEWTKARKGWPALIRKMTAAGVEIALSIVFPGYEADEIVCRLTWDEFFDKFDQLKLVFVYEEDDRNHKLSYCYAFV